MAPGKITKSDGSAFSILIVDDSMFQRKVITNIAIEMGFNNIKEAPDGSDAIEFYKKERPDIITLDITMPGKNGYDTLKDIMQFDSSAVAVMVSALTHDKIIKQCLEAGAAGYITKPFKAPQVSYQIGRILRKYYDARYPEEE